MRLVGSGAGIDITRLDKDIGILAQLGEIGAQGRLHLLYVDALRDLRLNLFQRRDTFGGVLSNFQDHPAMVGADGLGVLSALQREDLIFKALREHAPLEVLEVTALRRGGTGRFLLRDCDLAPFWS